jgi:sodium/hydrogen antiporter
VLIRVPIYLLSLIGSGVNRRGRLVIAWFGPSGLSSLLLVLLAVFAGVPGSAQIFAICSLIVLLSIVIHGTSPMLLARFSKKHEPAEPEIPSRTVPVPESSQPVGSQIINLEELKSLQQAGEEVILLDVRTERSRGTSDSHAKGSVRMPPENVVIQAREKNLPKDAWLVAYCA